MATIWLYHEPVVLLKNSHIEDKKWFLPVILRFPRSKKTVSIPRTVSSILWKVFFFYGNIKHWYFYNHTRCYKVTEISRKIPSGNRTERNNSYFIPQLFELVVPLPFIIFQIESSRNFLSKVFRTTNTECQIDTNPI